MGEITTGLRYSVDPLYQWDLNQVLTIYGLSLTTIPEIHFTSSAMERAIVRQATMDDDGVITVNIPNSLLQKPYTITAYVCMYEGETFETLHKIDIPVKARKAPADYTFVDDADEIYSFKKLENMIADIPYGKQGPKGEDGKTPVRGVDYWTKDDKRAILTEIWESLPDGDSMSYGRSEVSE